MRYISVVGVARIASRRRGRQSFGALAEAGVEPWCLPGGRHGRQSIPRNFPETPYGLPFAVHVKWKSLKLYPGWDRRDSLNRPRPTTCPFGLQQRWSVSPDQCRSITPQLRQPCRRGQAPITRRNPSGARVASAIATTRIIARHSRPLTWTLDRSGGLSDAPAPHTHDHPSTHEHRAIT